MNRDLCVKVCDGSQALWCENCGCKCGPYMGCGGKPMKRAPENKPLRKAAEILASKPFRCPWCQMVWAGCSNQNRWCSINKQADCWYQYCIEEGST